MSSTAGRVLIADFDGTLVRLRVDWAAMRERLGVHSIAELWHRGSAADFAALSAAECAGARDGEDNASAVAFASGFDAVAILTDNAEAAVARFLERYPRLQRHCVVIVGRETLGGPKLQPEVFRRGAERCLRALGAPAPELCTYLGDHPRELDLAEAMGLRVVDVLSLRPPQPGADDRLQ